MAKKNKQGKTTSKNTTPKEVVEKKVDRRSIYNCTNCEGEGLVKLTQRVCPVCMGTGKV